MASTKTNKMLTNPPVEVVGGCLLLVLFRVDFLCNLNYVLNWIMIQIIENKVQLKILSIIVFTHEIIMRVSKILAIHSS